MCPGHQGMEQPQLAEQMCPSVHGEVTAMSPAGMWHSEKERRDAHQLAAISALQR